MSATCSSEDCGHPIEAHGDRAIWPACEGTFWPPQSKPEYPGWLRTPKETACPCKGFK